MKLNLKWNFKELDAKKKTWIIAIAVVVLIAILGTFACLGIFRGFDANGYVSAILNQTMRGEVDEARRITEGATEATLRAQYEEGIRSFVTNSILSGVEATDEIEEKYVATCKKVFADMKFEVGNAEKISKNEYHVPVTYQPSDVFVKYMASIEGERTRLKTKAENGEYRGTLEEIYAKMGEELLNNSHTYFEEAYETMEFAEGKTMVFKVKKGESGLFEIEETQITAFLVKILGLDEIQD